MRFNRRLLVLPLLIALGACAGPSERETAGRDNPGQQSATTKSGTRETSRSASYEAWRRDWEKRYERLEKAMVQSLEIYRIALNLQRRQVPQWLAETSVQRLSGSVQDTLADIERSRSDATPAKLGNGRHATTVGKSERFLSTLAAQVRWIHDSGLRSFRGAETGRPSEVRAATVDIIEGLATMVDALVPVWADAIDYTDREQPQYALYRSMISSAPALTEIMRRLGDFLMDPRGRPKAMSAASLDRLDQAADWSRLGRRQTEAILGGIAQDKTLVPETSVVLQLFYESYPPSFDIEDEMIGLLRDFGGRIETINLRDAAVFFSAFSQLLDARSQQLNERSLRLRNVTPLLDDELRMILV